MKIREIRPHTTYIGDGGALRVVKQVTMDIGGGLSVSWKSVGTRNGSSGGEPIASFAKWAKTIKETISPDLKHYLQQ